MDLTPNNRCFPEESGGCSLIMPEKVLNLAEALGLSEPWNQLWQEYHQRGGTIEEYNDQSERAYYLEVMRTGNFAGLQVVQCLVGLCWNLTRWATEELRLPPTLAPQSSPEAWQPAAGMDLSQLLERAHQSGLRLYRSDEGGPLEVEDTAATAESRAWLHWLDAPIQLHLRLVG